MTKKASCLFLGTRGRPALLFLHGFMGCKEDWLETAAFFSGEHYCILPDLPGHGRAPISGNMSSVRWAEELRALLRREGYEQAAVCGYSMGGRLALMCRESYPGIFSKMILESVGPGMAGDRARARRLAEDRERARRLSGEGVDAFLESWYGLPLFRGLKEAAAYPAMLRRRLEGNPAGWARALEVFSIGRQKDYGGWLRRPDIPVLYMAGAWDEKYRTLAESLKNSPDGNPEVEIMAACSHNTHAMRHDLFCRRVDRFLRK